MLSTTSISEPKNQNPRIRTHIINMTTREVSSQLSKTETHIVPNTGPIKDDQETHSTSSNPSPAFDLSSLSSYCH